MANTILIWPKKLLKHIANNNYFANNSQGLPIVLLAHFTENPKVRTLSLSTVGLLPQIQAAIIPNAHCFKNTHSLKQRLTFGYYYAE